MKVLLRGRIRGHFHGLFLFLLQMTLQLGNIIFLPIYSGLQLLVLLQELRILLATLVLDGLDLLIQLQPRSVGLVSRSIGVLPRSLRRGHARLLQCGISRCRLHDMVLECFFGPLRLTSITASICKFSLALLSLPLQDLDPTLRHFQIGLDLSSACCTLVYCSLPEGLDLLPEFLEVPLCSLAAGNCLLPLRPDRLQVMVFILTD